MNTSERIAYLKGLADGLGIGTDSKEGKIITAIIETMEIMAVDMEELEENTLSLSEELEETVLELAEMQEDIEELGELCIPDKKRHGGRRHEADECDCCCDDDDECDCCCDDDDDDDCDCGHDHSGHDHSGHDHSKHDHSGHDHSKHDHSGHDHSAHDHSAHDHSGHDHSKHDHSGHDHDHDHEDEGPFYFDLVCPACDTEITIDEKTAAAGKINCPKCNELLELEFDEDDE